MKLAATLFALTLVFLTGTACKKKTTRDSGGGAYTPYCDEPGADINNCIPRYGDESYQPGVQNPGTTNPGNPAAGGQFPPGTGGPTNTPFNPGGGIIVPGQNNGQYPNQGCNHGYAHGGTYQGGVYQGGGNNQYQSGYGTFNDCAN